MLPSACYARVAAILFEYALSCCMACSCRVASDTQPATANSAPASVTPAAADYFCRFRCRLYAATFMLQVDAVFFFRY